MANEQNLIPLGSGKRSEKEEREMRSRGGKKSGETRRKKTAMKKVANLLLNMPVSEEAYPTIINTLQKMGFEHDNQPDSNACKYVERSYGWKCQSC